MKFGSTKTTKILDDNGSTLTAEKNIVKNEVTRPIRQRYEWKIRVHNQQQEHEEYLKFSDELKQDKSMIEPAFRIERNTLGDKNGYYYVVRCYTQLEY